MQTIEDSYRKQTEIDGEQVMLEILDTAGTEQFTAMRDLYMKNGEGFVLVYSVTSRASLNELADLQAQIVRIKDRDAAEIPIVVVGNKCDLVDDRMVETEEGAEVAKAWGAKFLEASARTTVNVDAVFETAVREIAAGAAAAGGKNGRKGKKKTCVIL